MLRMAEGTDPDRLRFVSDNDWTESTGDWNMSNNVAIGGALTVTGAATADDSIRTTNGRLQLGPHNSGAGLWFDRTSDDKYWFIGLDSANGTALRFYAAGANRFSVSNAGVGVFGSTVSLGTQASTTSHAVRADRNVDTGTGLTGGGNLTEDRTLSLVDIAAGSTDVGALAYNGTTSAAGKLDGGTTDPTGTTRLNYRGNFHATNLYEGGNAISGKYVPQTRTLDINGTTNQISVDEAGPLDLSANRAWTLSLPQNIHTAATPTFGGLTLTGGQTITGGNLLVRAANNQDGVRISGRAGGTGGWEVNIVPTTLSADRTLTLANGNTTLVTGTMVPTTTSITINGTANQIISSAGAQNLGANRTWTLSLPQNIHTTATPTFSDVSFGTGITAVRKYTRTLNINNTGWFTVGTVTGNSLASAVLMTVHGTAASIVISTTAHIIVNHSQDIYIRSESGIYTNLGIRIVSDNNEDFTIQINQPSSTVCPVNVEIIPLNSETIDIEVPITVLSGTELIHTAVAGMKISATGGNSGNLTIEGDFRAGGEITAYSASDKRLKDNIIPIQNALSKVIKLGGYEFDWNDKQTSYQGHDVGIVAQEIEEVLPEVVTTRDNGYKAVKYEKITPLLIEAIKEQNRTIEEQQRQIDELKDLVKGILGT
jgi:hypothetical protein